MKKIGVILALVMLGVPAIALAQSCPLLGMAEDLKLTDQQMEQIRSNMAAQKLDMIQFKASKEKARLELQELMLADKIDRKAILAKQDELSNIKAEMAKKRLSGRLDRLNFLNADQRAQVRKSMMFRQHDGKRGEFRRGQRQGPGMHMRGDRPMRRNMGPGMGPGMGYNAPDDDDD